MFKKYKEKIISDSVRYVAYSAKKFTPLLIEPEVSLSCSQEPPTLRPCVTFRKNLALIL
jgi:hypothetical protein